MRDEDAKRWRWILGMSGAAVLVIGVWALESKLQALRQDNAALRATVAALREGDGSCAVMDNGVRSVCWYEGGAVRVLPLRPGDVIVNRDCLAKHKKRRAACAR